MQNGMSSCLADVTLGRIIVFDTMGARSPRVDCGCTLPSFSVALTNGRFLGWSVVYLEWKDLVRTIFQNCGVTTTVPILLLADLERSQ